MNLQSKGVSATDEIPAEIVSGVRRGRLARIRAQMVARDLGARVSVNPVNVRYATDTRNMQIFTVRNSARYAFISAEDPVVLFEFASCAQLADGNEIVDGVRTATTASYVAAGGKLENATRRRAAEIAHLARTYGGDNRRIGKDDFDAGGYDGVIEPGMVLCVESFIGAEDRGEGVKLEQRIRITDTGYELKPKFPFEPELLGREI